MKTADHCLLWCAAVSSAWFFVSLTRLWPLADFPCFIDSSSWRQDAGALCERQRISILDASAARQLWVDEPAIDYVERAYGTPLTQALIRGGLPVIAHRVVFKAAGSPDNVVVMIGRDDRVLGWDRSIQEDAPGGHLDADSAEGVARRALGETNGAPTDISLVERSQSERSKRRDHRLVFEWQQPEAHGLRERREMVVAGDLVIKSWGTVVVPADEERATRTRLAPVDGIQVLGEAGLTLGGLAALWVFLTRLPQGRVRLGPPARCALVLWLLLVVVNLLQQARLFERWDPLWPHWLADGYRLLSWSLDDLTVVLPLFVFLAAADTLDRDLPASLSRGETLWKLGRGDLRDAGVVRASLRGFAVGCLCGGVLATGVLLLELCGARVGLQPRGFFFYPLNSAAPALTTLCFFAHIALFEELGYRFFAGTWIERLSGRRWLAILIPALVYGAMHSVFGFLPPCEPFWARPLLLALVGCVWGWAFFRFDALTVVLSHFTADLFIFNWPALASGRPLLVASAIGTILVPLIPGIIGMLWPRRATAISPPA
jgi:membrane protease YdiL (CAAX protease family)